MTNLDARLGRYTPAALSVFRIVVGLLFLCHGTSTLFGWPLGPALPAGDSLEWYAGCIEFATGLLVTLGYFTRPAAFVASGTMAVAFFTQHLPRGFFPIENSGEPAVLFCFSFLLLVFAGGGAYALEGLTGRRRKPARP
ncbi:MAG TPA: DoxX family protein [Mycobacterium sp.]|jgi:putative oxidoreductase|nr:DoxX family protein [Mycobacterium sp.]